MTNREKFLQDFGRQPPITTYCPYEDCPDTSRFKNCLQCMNKYWDSTYIPQTKGYWIYNPYAIKFVYSCSDYCSKCGLKLR